MIGNIIPIQEQRTLDFFTGLGYKFIIVGLVSDKNTTYSIISYEHFEISLDNELIIKGSDLSALITGGMLAGTVQNTSTLGKKMTPEEQKLLNSIATQPKIHLRLPSSKFWYINILPKGM